MIEYVPNKSGTAQPSKAQRVFNRIRDCPPLPTQVWNLVDPERSKYAYNPKWILAARSQIRPHCRLRAAHAGRRAV